MKSQVHTRFQFTFTEDEYLTLAGLVLAGQEASGHESRELARVIDEFTRYADLSETDEGFADEVLPPEGESYDPADDAEAPANAVEAPQAPPDRRSFLRRR